MRCCFRVLVILAFVASAPVFCYSDSATPEEIEANERLLERWKSDPEHYARLQADLRAFWQLPPERRDRLRQLDQELHDADSITQQRLYGVMERYGAWYERLPEPHQRRLDKTADRNDRVHLVKQLREDQWLARQPKQVRDDLARLPEGKRRHEIAKQRDDDRKRVAGWIRATGAKSGAVGQLPGERPVRASDFPPETERYINEVLKPQLREEEREHLGRAEGKWPHYAKAVLDLSDKHPVKLPGPSTGPASFEKLPKEYTAIYKSQKDVPPSVYKFYGRWPEYASAMTEAVRSKNLSSPLPQLGPCRPADFAAPIKEFLDNTLSVKLSDKEKEELSKTEGRWPDYPAKVKELADKYGLEVPLMKMPNANYWRDKVNNTLPEVPNHLLTDFAVNDLNKEDWKRMGISLTDPGSREKLVKAYLDSHPEDFRRMKEHDEHNMQFNSGKGPGRKPGGH
jgi:hypothetical protein